MEAKNSTKIKVCETKNDKYITKNSGGTTAQTHQRKNIHKRKSWLEFFFGTKNISIEDKNAKSTISAKGQTVATTIQPQVTAAVESKNNKTDPTIQKETKPLTETSSVANILSKIKNLPMTSEVEATSQQRIPINKEKPFQNDTKPLTSNLAAMFSKSKHQKISGGTETPVKVKKSAKITPNKVVCKTKARGGGLKLFLVRMVLSAGAIYSTCYLNVWGSPDDSQQLAKKIKSTIFKT